MTRNSSAARITAAVTSQASVQQQRAGAPQRVQPEGQCHHGGNDHGGTEQQQAVEDRQQLHAEVAAEAQVEQAVEKVPEGGGAVAVGGGHAVGLAREGWREHSGRRPPGLDPCVGEAGLHGKVAPAGATGVAWCRRRCLLGAQPRHVLQHLRRMLGGVHAGVVVDHGAFRVDEKGFAAGEGDGADAAGDAEGPAKLQLSSASSTKGSLCVRAKSLCEATESALTPMTAMPCFWKSGQRSRKAWASCVQPGVLFLG